MRMMMAVAALMSLLGTRTHAQTPEMTADLRCVAALSIIGAQKKEYASGAALGVMYFVGRIEGRQPDFELQPALSAELGRLEPRDLGLEAERCGKLMAEKGQELNKIGRHLQGAPAPKL